MRMARIALTAGEPAGVGPELVARVAMRDWPAQLVAFADPDLLRARAAALGLALTVHAFDASQTPRAHRAGELACVAHTLAAPSLAGTLDTRNADYVLATLESASQACLSGACQALVTAPVQKSVLDRPAHPFKGHTEFFAERARADVLMLLAAGDLRVALATTHLSLRAVADAIDDELIERCVRLLERGLRERLRLARPRIAVLGLNPHAGEDGHLGREEIERIAPALARLRDAGIAVRGPLSADTAFVPVQRAQTDAYLAMYHDQGLPVLKALGFGHAVNITLGLPYVRTSVDHGTALDLAGSGRADEASLIEALRCAIEWTKPDRS
jgi:4-hydroxythreonine-4-phosphate dehydrogenase